MRISDWSSDVFPSDLTWHGRRSSRCRSSSVATRPSLLTMNNRDTSTRPASGRLATFSNIERIDHVRTGYLDDALPRRDGSRHGRDHVRARHCRQPGRGEQIGRANAELQSLMRISYAVLCLKKKKYF